MNHQPIQQQIIVSGIGGQGVLFVAGMLADLAIHKGLAVLTSETHGMAQRGGTVIAHVKIGEFSSPLIRPFHADGLIALKMENLAQHQDYVKEGGWAIVNHSKPIETETRLKIFTIDADRMAQEAGNPKSVNLIVLGFAICKNQLFCAMDDVKTVMEKRLISKPKLLTDSLNALEAGYRSML